VKILIASTPGRRWGWQGNLFKVYSCEYIKMSVKVCLCERREGGREMEREGEREEVNISLCEQLLPERSEVVHHLIAVYTNITSKIKDGAL
jgi:hypothetical protein